MKTATFALILLATATVFTGAARADESETNRESQRVRSQMFIDLMSGTSTARFMRTDRMMMSMVMAFISDAERAFLRQGDRGIGNN